ncbi:cyclase [Streptomyces viridochromogenes]|uniref:Cyclase n=1 Tax=Streptomyces viridochromogenes TaxID=1938 RepID=A0A0J7ZMS2_STRVR|nr:cyclase family protein [Streptomyces viridochromogenes]KMS77331.1 cyclase [Streptomyces viridochromogenes]KOG19054.1 cyclase [Streptomyces viridochromogenes]KOG19293.1 cyclase [Streptomyces viridochromogenes]
MRIIDLSSPVDARAWEPDPVVHEILTPAEGARHMAAEMKEHFGVDFDPAVLPGGELLSLDTFTLTSHTGTHVDAPAHYGSAAVTEYGEPLTAEQLPLDWFLRPAVVLDLRDQGTGAVGVPVLERAIKATGHHIQPMDIVVLHTGAWHYAGTQRYFTDFTGLTGEAVDFLLDIGVKVIGTDAFSLDAPFGDMIRRYQDSGDRSVLWPAHFAGRRRPYCQIERLHNLDALPAAHGFRISCLPVKLAGSGAGWARAVALVED